MAVKKTKKQTKNNSGAFLGISIGVVLLVLIIFIVLGSNSSSDTSKTLPNDSSSNAELSCSTLCEDSGYSGAVSNSCTSIVECGDPNYPLIDDSQALCSDLEVCCCQVGL